MDTNDSTLTVHSYQVGPSPISNVNHIVLTIPLWEGPSYLKIAYEKVIIAYRLMHIHLIDKFNSNKLKHSNNFA